MKNNKELSKISINEKGELVTNTPLGEAVFAGFATSPFGECIKWELKKFK